MEPCENFADRICLSTTARWSRRVCSAECGPAGSGELPKLGTESGIACALNWTPSVVAAFMCCESSGGVFLLARARVLCF